MRKFFDSTIIDWLLDLLRQLRVHEVVIELSLPRPERVRYIYRYPTASPLRCLPTGR